MTKINSLWIQIVAVVIAGVVMSGCAAMQEGFASQMEVPTLEKQANRVAIGMTIVRENNIMAFKMPISADAKWPMMVSAELNATQKQGIANILQEEPYFATVHYSENIQRRMLGSSATLGAFGNYANLVGTVFNQTISPLTFRAVQKVEAFYGNDKKNWPNFFNFDSSLGNFLDFKDGQMREVEALSGDVYPNIGSAMIALTPTNMQKDLTVARSEMLQAYEDVAAIKAEKGEKETTLKTDIAKTKSKEDKNYSPLTSEEKLAIKNDLRVIEERIKQAESIADEKEQIYFTLLDEAVVALQSDINIDDKDYVNLAKNVNIVSKEIQSGATEAYASFGLALTNIASNNILLKFPRELESLAYAKAYVPSNLQAKYNERIGRLVKNAVYLLPNIFIGTYYANKQSSLAEKYQAVTDIIVLAYQVKVDQENAAKDAAKDPQPVKRK